MLAGIGNRHRSPITLCNHCQNFLLRKTFRHCGIRRSYIIGVAVILFLIMCRCLRSLVNPDWYRVSQTSGVLCLQVRYINELGHHWLDFQFPVHELKLKKTERFGHKKSKIFKGFASPEENRVCAFLSVMTKMGFLTPPQKKNKTRRCQNAKPAIPSRT